MLTAFAVVLLVSALSSSCSAVGVGRGSSLLGGEDTCVHGKVAASLEVTRDVAVTVLSEEGFRTAFLGDMIRADRRHYALLPEGVPLLGSVWPITLQTGYDGKPKRHHSLRVQLDLAESRGQTCLQVGLTSIGFDLDSSSAGQIQQALAATIERRVRGLNASNGELTSAPSQ